jgi:hypothetical protein
VGGHLTRNAAGRLAAAMRLWSCACSVRQVLRCSTAGPAHPPVALGAAAGAMTAGWGPGRVGGPPPRPASML